MRAARGAGRTRQSRTPPSAARARPTPAPPRGRAMGGGPGRARPPPRPGANPPAWRRGGYVWFAPLVLLGDDVVLDLVVSGLRHDFLRDQPVLSLVRPVFDYLFLVGVPDGRDPLPDPRRGGRALCERG